MPRGSVGEDEAAGPAPGGLEQGGRRISGYYRDEFGRLARYYDFGVRTAFRLAGGEHVFRYGIVEAADVQTGQRVLDVSCGTGTLAGYLASCAGPGGQVTGVDLSEEMLMEARRKHKAPNIEFIQANAENLPFEDSSFDRVTISLAIHEMNREGRRNALAEMRRVLKPGGLALVADMRRPDTWYTRMGARFIGLVETETLTDLWESGLYREMGRAGFTGRRRRLAGHGFFEIVVGRK